MARPPIRDRGSDRDTPGELPEVPPGRFQSATHDFTLQAVIEMQRSIGDLTAKVDRLISDVDKQGTKIDTVRLRMAWVAGGAAVVGALLTALVVVLKAIPWDALAAK